MIVFSQVPYAKTFSRKVSQLYEERPKIFFAALALIYCFWCDYTNSQKLQKICDLSLRDDTKWIGPTAASDRDEITSMCKIDDSDVQY